MEKAKYAIRYYINDYDSVECEVVRLSHKIFDLFEATFINLNGEEEKKSIVLSDLTPKNEKAATSIRNLLGRL